MKLLSPLAMNGGFNITFHSNNVVHSLLFAFFAYDRSSFVPETWKNEKVCIFFLYFILINRVTKVMTGHFSYVELRWNKARPTVRYLGINSTCTLSVLSLQ